MDEFSSVYLVEEGEVDILIDGDLVATRSRTYLGEISAIGERRSATVRAKGRVRCTEMDRHTFAEKKTWYFLTPIEEIVLRASMHLFDEKHKIFAAIFVIATSALGSLIVALETSTTPTGMPIASLILFVLLVCEFVFRMAMCVRKACIRGAMTFLKDPWHWVAFIVILGWLPAFDKNPQGLRSLVLLRVLQYAMGLPKLRTLVYGTIGGMQMMVFIVVSIMLIVYVYAIVGLSLFKENDPWHFGDLQRAMTTLFRAATLEDWTEVFYVNYFGCNEYAAGIYVAVGQEQKLRYSTCEQSEGKQGTAIMFFFTFIMLCLAMFAMFIGALSIKMAEAVKEVHRETVMARMRKQRKLMVTQSTSSMKQQESMKEVSWDDTEVGYKPQTVAEMNAKSMVRCLLKEIFEGKPYPHVEIPESTPFRRTYLQMSINAGDIAHSPSFNALIMVVLLLSAMLMGIETSDSAMDTLGITSDGLYTWNVTVAMIFVIEMALKVLEEGFQPWHVFFKDKRLNYSNAFDFFVVFANIVTLFTSGGTWVVLLRVSRLLKVFSGDTMKSFPNMRLPVLSFVMSAELLVYTAALFLGLVFFFAAAAVSLYRTNDPVKHTTFLFTLLSQIVFLTVPFWKFTTGNADALSLWYPRRLVGCFVHTDVRL